MEAFDVDNLLSCKRQRKRAFSWLFFLIYIFSGLIFFKRFFSNISLWPFNHIYTLFKKMLKLYLFEFSSRKKKKHNPNENFLTSFIYPLKQTNRIPCPSRHIVKGAHLLMVQQIVHFVENKLWQGPWKRYIKYVLTNKNL